MDSPTVWVCGALSVTAHLFLLQPWQTPTEWGSVHRPAKPHALAVRQLQAAALQPATTKALVLTEPRTGSAPPPPTVETQEEASQHASASTLSGDQDDVFIPRPQLSIPPVAQTPIVLPDINAVTQSGRFAGILALFIDETGRVHHITPLEPRLPLNLEKAAIEAFMAVQFTPGELRGTIVKSRIKMEVVFEKAPITAPVPLQ